MLLAYSFYNTEFICCIVTHEQALGSSRKYPYTYHRRHFGIPNGWGGSQAWNSEGEGGFAGLEFRMRGGAQTSEFPKLMTVFLKSLSLQ